VHPFLAHLAKDNVSFCHHLASVVCRPLTLHILIFSSNIVLIHQQTLPPQAILVSDWPIFFKSLSIDTSYQVSVHLAKQFQRRRISKISQSETRISCGGHVC
jgi:hypothetical protein